MLCFISTQVVMHLNIVSLSCIFRVCYRAHCNYHWWQSNCPTSPAGNCCQSLQDERICWESSRAGCDLGWHLQRLRNLCPNQEESLWRSWFWFLWCQVARQHNPGWNTEICQEVQWQSSCPWNTGAASSSKGLYSFQFVTIMFKMCNKTISVSQLNLK